jgi:hypothetical protein
MGLAKLEAWRKRLGRKSASRLSVAEFCRREGVSVQSFYYWKRRLGGPLAAQPAAFVPVRIVEAPASSSVEIELPNRARVRVPLEIARERLAEIVQAAGAAACHGAATSAEAQRC